MPFALDDARDRRINRVHGCSPTQRRQAFSLESGCSQPFDRIVCVCVSSSLSLSEAPIRMHLVLAPHQRPVCLRHDIRGTTKQRTPLGLDTKQQQSMASYSLVSPSSNTMSMETKCFLDFQTQEHLHPGSPYMALAVYTCY